MTENLSFDQLPKAVTELTLEIGKLKRLIQENQERNLEVHSEQFFNVEEAAAFLKLTVPTVYSKVSNGELPVMKRGKRLYFSSTELMEYLKRGRRKSNAQIEQEAANYVSKKQKG